MENIEYANAYSEVLEILKSISKEDYEKIPIEKINLFETNANKNYKFQYDATLTLDEQNISKRAKAIIAILFRDYWATPYQKERIEAKEKYDRQKAEEEKREQYNPNDIFKRKQKDNEKDENIQAVNNNLPIEVKKEKFYEKIVNFFKKLFHL